MHIFLDACIIIYWAELKEPFYTTLIKQLEDITNSYPDHTLAISRLSFLECLVKPLRKQNKETLLVYQQFFMSSTLKIIEIDTDVIDLATHLRVEYNIRTPDAIQAASCINAHSNHLFLTNDKRFSSIKTLNSHLLGFH